MVTLKIHNDGKEKYQSFEAWIDGIDCEKGYGASKAEAISEYKKELKRYSLRITVASQDMSLGNFEEVSVDWTDKAIKRFISPETGD